MLRQTDSVRLRPGDAAPSPTILTPDGAMPLADLWTDTSVLVAFLRHFG